MNLFSRIAPPGECLLKIGIKEFLEGKRGLEKLLREMNCQTFLVPYYGITVAEGVNWDRPSFLRASFFSLIDSLAFKTAPEMISRVLS